MCIIDMKHLLGITFSLKHLYFIYFLQFLRTCRKRLQLTPTQAFFLIVNEKNLVSISITVGEVYKDEKDEDGFIYMVYASQETFGSSDV